MRQFQIIVMVPHHAVVVADTIEAAAEQAREFSREYYPIKAPNNEFDPVGTYVHSVTELKNDSNLSAPEEIAIFRLDDHRRGYPSEPSDDYPGPFAA